jgi:hypothetical protein
LSEDEEDVLQAEAEVESLELYQQALDEIENLKSSAADLLLSEEKEDILLAEAEAERLELY